MPGAMLISRYRFVPGFEPTLGTVCARDVKDGMSTR